jgi:hypothetical protein
MTATINLWHCHEDRLVIGSAPMDASPVRVVGSAALRTLMAYGATVFDLRQPDSSEHHLCERLSGSGIDSDRLILLLASDVPASLETAAGLQQRGYPCVVVVNAESDPA